MRSVPSGFQPPRMAAVARRRVPRRSSSVSPARAQVTAGYSEYYIPRG